MNNHPAEVLLELSAALIEAMGSPGEDALIVGRHLVEAQLAGHDSHGLIRLPQYHAHVLEGERAKSRRGAAARQPSDAESAIDP